MRKRSGPSRSAAAVEPWRSRNRKTRSSPRLVIAPGHEAAERALTERAIELPDHVGGEGDREGDPDSHGREEAPNADDRRSCNGRSEDKAEHDEHEVAESPDTHNHSERLAAELSAPGAGVEYQVEGVERHRNGEPCQRAPGNCG